MVNKCCFFFFIILGSFCASAQAPSISYTPLQTIIPSEGIPEEIDVQRANNNLDLILFQGRYYAAFRTAPTHFASKKAYIYVMSSTDLQDWAYEYTVHVKSDLREPRFLELNGELFLYCFQGGTKMLSFEPQHLWVAKRSQEGSWDMEMIEEMDGFVPWRLRTRDGVAYLSAYYGVGLYQSDHVGDLRLFKSTNGYNWEPLSEEPQVSTSGAEEGEFIFDEEGNLWATVRLEGMGAYVAYADKDSLHNWHLYKTKKKYDSAMLFKHDGNIYLISRRNLDGDFDKAPKWFPYAMRQKVNLIKYSLTEKVTAVYQLDKTTKTIVHLFDLPSTGDTAFPGIAPLTDTSYALLNYSSPIEKRSRNWVRGQLGRTFIYLTELHFHTNPQHTATP